MRLLARCLPLQPPNPPREILRAAAGAGLGIGITAVVSTVTAGQSGDTPLLIAPIGASAVLLFAVPASPLAQPLAILHGNLIAAFVGVTAAWLIPVPTLAAVVAVSVAIAIMTLCRSIHPPSGAVALVAVLGGAHVHSAGYGFVAIPVLLNTALLTAVAIGWNNLTGRSFPHQAHPPALQPAPEPQHILTRADFEDVIAQYGETLTIDPEDLRVLHAALCRKGG